MTIVYAIIGVPMMLLCLANIGTSMANLFRFLYARVCCGYCNYVKKRHIRMKAATLTTAAASHANAISYAALATTNLIINNAQNVMSTIDTANLVSNNESAERMSLSKEESAAGTMPIDPATAIIINENKKAKIPDLKYDSLKLAKSAQNENELMELFEETNSIDYKKITVPISLTLFVLSSYILLGGILFKTIEGWTVLEGVYFCFITLSTIGLGDYVPGNSIKDTDTQAELKLVGCSLYLLMGLSLIAMCFNLMQEEVTAKFRRLAVRLGIIDDPNYW
jgi:hypothetical protein